MAFELCEYICKHSRESLIICRVKSVPLPE